MRDVVIGGGGPVGMFAACLLAVRGLDVEVLEQRTSPSMRSRAIGIHPPSLHALASIGVADAILARAVRIGDGEVHCDGRRLGRLSFEKAARRYPFVVALPQYETEALLRARFDELSPGAFRGGVSVTDVRDRGDHIEVRAADGGTVIARYVIAADGARSRMREAAGIGWRELGRPDTYLMADYPDSGAGGEAGAGAAGGAGARGAGDVAGVAAAGGSPAATAVLYFERGGVVESFPLPGNRRRWVAMTDGLLADASSRDLAGVIRSRTRVDLPTSSDAPSPFAVQQRLADRFVARRLVLIGDAAHEISPIGGQGMNLGWLDAVALVPALEQALREPEAAAPVLARFDRRRRRAARMAARQAGFNMAMGRPAAGARLAVRNGLVRVLALPPARAVLARAFTMRWL
jgi:2-polyprenyl-6-methoxyphenol hydroxylase-like FAD-dependent oxidoreductase